MSSRKLQQEFDKLQKKVAEGLQQFDEIHDKINATDNASLKEKLEGDLRKEIKKLQRSRDQVKQWSGDSSNKLDKNVLADSRARIENAMERFKEVEKISKLKQFSNEGLELQTKLGARGVDEAKKNDAVRYVTESMEELGRQSELLQAESSQLSARKKSSATSAAVEELAQKIERNNGHVAKLELILRNLENGQLAPERLDEIRDDLDYYLENNSSPDFVEYDDFYDLLDLDEDEEADDPEREEREREEREREEREKRERQETERQEKEKQEKEKQEKEKQDKEKERKKSEPKKEIPRAKPAGLNVAAPPPNQWANSQLSRGHSAPMSASAAATPPPTAPATARAPPPGLNPHKPPTPAPRMAEDLKKKAEEKHSGSHGTSGTGGAPASPSVKLLAKNVPRASASPELGENSPLSGVAALAHSRLSHPPPFAEIASQLEASLLNCPDSFDSEKPRQYNPTNVHPSSVDYPQEPMYELNSSAIMRKFDTDTLFFCFYYNEGVDNLAKFNAAHELSRRGWVLNVETKQWFSKEEKVKRHSVFNLENTHADADRGSYKYFDYESSWLVRRKDNFEFRPELKRTF